MAAVCTVQAAVAAPAQLCSTRSFGRALPVPTRAVRTLRVATVVRAKASDAELASFQENVTRAAAFSTVASTFLAAGNAQAAQEIATLAAGDNRLGALFLLLTPVLGWVAFNIGGPALNQLDGMKRSVAVGLGLGAATLLAAQSADAASQVAELAAGDNRIGVIATLFVPVIGWVAFNIGAAALNQLNNMGAGDAVAKVTKKRRAVVSGLGLGAAASLLMVDNADAATEVMQLAAGDNRFGIIATLFLPVVGWVAFNIGGPALNQLKQAGAKK